MSTNPANSPNCPSCVASSAFRIAEEIVSLEESIDQLDLFLQSAPLSREHFEASTKVMKSLVLRLDIARKRLKAMKERYPDHKISHPVKGDLSSYESYFKRPV